MRDFFVKGVALLRRNTTNARKGQEIYKFAYNRLGIGKSSKPKEPQTGIVMVKDLKELLLSLKIEPPCLIVGHSLSGFIAHLFTITYPDDVRGLVFLESSTIKDVLTDSKRKKETGPNKFSEVDHVLSTIKQIQELGVFPNTKGQGDRYLVLFPFF